ncbi:MAG: phosphoglycerate kinase [Candidatus Micrarchaeota archaeon]|nr:phosphoglycerate kinase [Candidatus Micrarchaeota archaeon]
MEYLQEMKGHKLVNLYSQLKGPVLLRVDLNSPKDNEGMIVANSLRLRINADMMGLYAQHAGLVVLAHQGRKGDDDFGSLKEQHRLLLGMLPRDIEIEFIPHDAAFALETRAKIAKLAPGHIMLYENVREFDFETKFDAKTCPYINFFKGVINTCVNDAIGVLHRKDASMRALPYIAPTFVGMPTMSEIWIMESVRNSKEKKVLISGGKKPEKADNLKAIHMSGIEGLTGGVVGQAIARMRGHDMGESNNAYIELTYSQDDIEAAKMLASLDNVSHPLDFVILENGETRTVELGDLRFSKGLICDIGPMTVEEYARRSEEKEIRWRAGPLGRAEDPRFRNGVELTKRIVGPRLAFLGGDTAHELAQSGLESLIKSAGGEIMQGGGSILHGLAGKNYPSLDDILELQRK